MPIDKVSAYFVIDANVCYIDHKIYQVEMPIEARWQVIEAESIKWDFQNGDGALVPFIEVITKSGVIYRHRGNYLTQEIPTTRRGSQDDL
jgi:hypothetical protein